MARILKGRVVSDKMEKTIVIVVTRMKNHPIYQKKYKVTKKYKVHDENNSFKVGDEVSFSETRPLSKDKRWVVVEVKDKKTTLLSVNQKKRKDKKKKKEKK